MLNKNKMLREHNTNYYLCMFTLRVCSYVLYIRSHMYAYSCGGCALPLPSSVYKREGTAVTTEKEKRT